MMRCVRLSSVRGGMGRREHLEILRRRRFDVLVTRERIIDLRICYSSSLRQAVCASRVASFELASYFCNRRGHGFAVERVNERGPDVCRDGWLAFVADFELANIEACACI